MINYLHIKYQGKKIQSGFCILHTIRLSKSLENLTFSSRWNLLQSHIYWSLNANFTQYFGRENRLNSLYTQSKSHVLKRQLISIMSIIVIQVIIFIFLLHELIRFASFPTKFSNWLNTKFTNVVVSNFMWIQNQIKMFQSKKKFMISRRTITLHNG